MYYQYGYFKPLVAKKLGRVITARQFAPALLVSATLVAAVVAPWLGAGRQLFCLVLGGYVATDVIVSAATVRRAGLRVGLALSAVFPVLHFAYGVGWLVGAFDFLICGKRPAPGLALSR